MSASPQAKILIVDDDARNLMALHELLHELGHHLVPAKSGEEALRQVLKHDFAVILLDVHMPGIDGFGTAKLIHERQHSAHTPIIFITGASENMLSQSRGYAAGAVDYIVKPIVPEILKAKVSVFVELHKKNEALAEEIAERKRAEAELRVSEQILHDLAAHLQSVREEEQARIAREIHDDLGQALTGLKMDLTWVASRVADDQKPLTKKITSMFRLIDESIHSMRRIASGLRPEVLDEVGLAAAIGWQVREFQMRTGIRCKVDLPPDAPQLPERQATALFRIFQEALTNVARHAHATRVGVLMHVNQEKVVLEVQDNGKSIADADIQSRKSLGLLGMRERALALGGSIDIAGCDGKGTTVRVSIPLH